jgi:hypothetical protein
LEQSLENRCCYCYPAYGNNAPFLAQHRLSQDHRTSSPENTPHLSNEHTDEAYTSHTCQVEIPPDVCRKTTITQVIL